MSTRIYYYSVDTEGILWHRGSELEDPKILALFMRDLEPLAPPDHEYRWRVLCMGEECRVSAEDVPYVVQRWEPKRGEIELIFPGDYRERLDPTTLFVGKKNVLYCRVRGGKFIARFRRQPYLDLAKQIAFDAKEKKYYLALQGKRYWIEGVK